MKSNTIKLATLLFCGWISLSLMSFACRQEAGEEVSTELQAEIETTEAEAASIEQTEKEIEEAAAKVDALLKEID